MDKLADKLPPPALNRPLTQQRAPDPGRFRSIDMLPDNAQQDPSYQRMVQDIEALQHRQGWLAGRGAFDKEDLLYLRDREEQQRLTEQEQRDMEAAAYAAARARIEREQEAAARAALRQQHPVKQQQNKLTQHKGVIPVLKVKAHHSKEEHQQQQQQHQALTGQVHQTEQHQERDNKRPRLGDDGSTHAVAEAADSAAGRQSSAAACAASAKDQGSGPASAAAPAAASGSRASNGTQSSGQPQQQAQPPSQQEQQLGLKVLLGYSSDSEDGDKPSNTSHAASIPQQGLRLPSAAELLEQDMPSSFAPAPSNAPEDKELEVLHVVSSGAAYQPQTGWI